MTLLVLFAALAALGLIAGASLAALARMRRGLDEVGAALAGRLDANAGQLHARLDGVTAQVSQRLDAVGGQVDARLGEATQSLDRRLAENTRRLDEQLARNTRSLDERLGASMALSQQSSREVGERLANVSRVVGDVQASLGQLGEASQRIFEIGRDIASLQDILQAPKLRGGLGELFLAEVLAQILTPQHYALQHRFRNGETVDAVVRLGAGLVPIDSKFPLEAFRRLTQLEDEAERSRERRQFARDVKRHVDAIAKKYILPDEGTFDFAFLYIPAENVYYEVILRDEDLGEGGSLLEYALGRHVIPVSPSSFYAYLQSILLGLKGLRIEQRAREIYGHLQRLQGDLERFGEPFEILGKHLKNAQNAFDRADGMRKRLEAKLEATAQIGTGADEGPGRLAVEPAEIPLFPDEPAPGDVVDEPELASAPADHAEVVGEGGRGARNERRDEVESPPAR